jgi:tetratricopeptide (TPR) repeat protein
MRARPLFVALVAALLLAAPRAGRTQPAADPARVPAADPAAVERGLELAKQAASAYKEGRFAEAIALYEQAHAVHPDPITLHNLGRCQEALGSSILGDIEPERADPHALRDAAARFRSANASYRRFLEAEPDTPSRQAVEQRIRALDTQIKLLEDIARPREEPAPAPEPDPARVAAPWIVAGLGGATLIAGVVMAVLAKGREGDANDPATSGEDAAAAADDARTFSTTANVLFAVGGAVALAGATWGFVDLATSDGGASASLVVRPFGAGFVARF